MESFGALLRHERLGLGLSTRDLARLAGVSYPTISRIENDHEQPRLDTLGKILQVLGKTLALVDARNLAPRLADLVDIWSLDEFGEPVLDWTRLRGLVDRIHLHPEHTATVITPAPPPSGSSLVDNVLAAIAEKVADDVGLRRPPWTRGVPRLREPWSAPSTPRRRADLVARTPSQFAERNITMPATTIWRDRDPVLS